MNHNGWKRTTDGPQTGDQVRSSAEEDGKEPDRIEDQQEEKVKSPLHRPADRTTLMAPDENAPVSQDDDKSALAVRELIRVLEAAASSGVESVGLEWRGNDLLVFHESECVGKITKQLQLEVISEIVTRARIGRKHKGNMPLPLLGQDYSVAVEEYDRFGESAYMLMLKKRGKKRVE